jgi:hypothetical protein
MHFRNSVVGSIVYRCMAACVPYLAGEAVQEARVDMMSNDMRQFRTQIRAVGWTLDVRARAA